MTNNEKLFRQKVEKLAKVYVAKNKDYGDSFTRSLDKYGILASLIRMGDKMNRIDSLYDKPTSEVDESLIDSLEDLANYAIMTAIWLEKQVEGEVDYTDSTFYVSDDPYFTIRKYSNGRTENITYFDDDDFEDDFDEHEFDDLFDDDHDDDDDDDIDAFLDMLSNFDSGEDTNEGTHTDYFNCGFDDECTHGDYFNFGSEDDEPEDDPDDFSMDGLPKFRIVRRPKGGLSNEDYRKMIMDLYITEGSHLFDDDYLDMIRYLFGTEGD